MAFEIANMIFPQLDKIIKAKNIYEFVGYMSVIISAYFLGCQQYCFNLLKQQVY